MNRRSLCFVALALLGPALPSTASGAADDELARCAKLENRDERFACYDEVERKTPSASAEAADASSDESYLTRAWQLGPNERGPRHIIDIVSYRPNFIDWHSTDQSNTRPRSPATGRTSLGDLSADEVKIQASFKTELVSRRAFERAGVTRVLSQVGVDSARLWFAHTQKMAYQLLNHSDSRPMRETNYEPEVILTFGTRNQGNGLKLINLGLVHESNGLDQRQHRGWSRTYVQAGWEWDRFSLLGRAWHVVQESDDDNPNIRTFLGSGDLVARYQSIGGYVASVLLRGNVQTQKNLLQIDWASPPSNALGGLKFHVQLSSGYGETLLDYNFRQNTIGIGVSFGDW
jgi:phospholipase A1